MSDKADKAAEKINETYDNALPDSVVKSWASIIRSHTAPRELVGEPEAWIIEHSFTDRNGDGADAQLFGMREEAEEKRQDLIILWLDEQPENVTEAPDDLYPIIPLYRSALSAQEPKVCPDCGGEGWVSETVQVDVDEYGDAIGEQIQADCPKCEGTGVIKVKES